MMDGSVYGRPFGVEFEIPTSMQKQALVDGLRMAGHKVSDTGDYNHAVTPGWKVVSDSSIEPHGWEFVSPILKGVYGLGEIRKFCQTLEDMGVTFPWANTSCGMHVHVSASDIQNDGDATAKLISFHHHIERHGLMDCVPPYRRGNRWCKDTNSQILDRAKRGPITFEEVRQISNDRYVSLNMYGRCADYKTVEFRLHGGTSDASKAVSWIMLCLRMVQASKTLGRSGYGSNLEECLLATGLRGDHLHEFAKRFLLQRQKHFKGVRNVQLPSLPRLPQMDARAQTRRFGLTSWAGFARAQEVGFASREWSSDDRSQEVGLSSFECGEVTDATTSFLGGSTSDAPSAKRRRTA